MDIVTKSKLRYFFVKFKTTNIPFFLLLVLVYLDTDPHYTNIMNPLKPNIHVSVIKRKIRGSSVLYQSSNIQSLRSDGAADRWHRLRL